MAEKTGAPKRQRFGLKDVSGTTIAVTSLAILGGAALVTTPLWLWYRRKRKRADALARSGSPAARAPQEQPVAAPEPATDPVPEPVSKPEAPLARPRPSQD